MKRPATAFPWRTGGIFMPGSEDPRTSIWGPVAPGMQSGHCVASQVRPADAALIIQKVSGNPCSWCGSLHLACQSRWYEHKKCCPDCTHRERVPVPDWAHLLLECRDALPAITEAAARVRGIDLTLADRITEILKPWRTADDDPEGK
jgi:hypothetical protein